MLLDFHTHAFPDYLAPRAMGSLSRSADFKFYHDGTIAGLKTVMAQAGITHAVLCNIAVKPGQTQKIFDFSCQVMNQEKSGQVPNIIPFASVHPFEEDWRGWLQKIKDAGFLGIKLHPDYQGFFIDDPRMEPFYLETARLGLIVLFHAGFDDGLPEPVHATPERTANVLPVLEQGKTILSHMGGYLMWDKVLGLLCGSNVYFDNSLRFEQMDKELAKKLFRAHTPDKILFGTDAPWSDPVDAVRYFRDDFAKGFLSREDTQKVLWENGAALLQLD